MQTQAKRTANDVSGLARRNVLRITAEQLRAWVATQPHHGYVVPKTDEEIWEDTEIDVRRTAL